MQDHLGTTRVVINESGTTAGQYDYDAWGEVIWQSDTPPRKGFIDKETDKESKLGDYGERKYDATLGRFGSIDRYWENYRSLSPYQYAANNPLVAKDPTGMLIEWQGTDEEKAYGEQKYNEAINYLEQNGAQEAADKLKDLRDNESYTIKVYASAAVEADENRFDPASETLQWNPTKAVEFDNAWLSPAEILAHEGDHAQSFKKDPDEHMYRTNTPDFKYTNLEEKRVIANETETARAIGHLKDNSDGLETRLWNNPPKHTFHTVTNVGGIVKSNIHTPKKNKR